MPHFLRLGEYGIVLAVIPGTVLSILTGQFVFAASPIAISLWLNVFRRAWGDRETGQILLEHDQEATHRYDSALASSQRERMDMLIDQAGVLDPRDHPQLLQVLRYRLHCIHEKRASLEAYLEESYQTILSDIHALQELQVQQQQTLEDWIELTGFRIGVEREDVDGRVNVARFDERLADLSERIAQLQQICMSTADRIDWWRRQLVTFDHTLDQLECGERIDLSRQEIWNPSLDSVMHQLERLERRVQTGPGDQKSSLLEQGMLSLETRLESMHRMLMEQLDQWELFHREQGYTLQRLNSRLTQASEQVQIACQAMDEERVLNLILEQRAAINSPGLVRLLGSLEAIPLIKQELAAIQEQCRPPVSFIQNRLAQVTAQAAEKIEQIEDQYNHQEEQIHPFLTPLLHNLSDCDERLGHLSQVAALKTIESRIRDIESDIQAVSAQCETALSTALNHESPYRDLQVQLAVLRAQLEELDSHVTLSLKQIPYFIENHIRQKFSPGQGSNLIPSSLD